MYLSIYLWRGTGTPRGPPTQPGRPTLSSGLKLRGTVLLLLLFKQSIFIFTSYSNLTYVFIYYLFIKRNWNTTRAPSTANKASTQLRPETSGYWAAVTTFILIYIRLTSNSNFTFVFLALFMKRYWTPRGPPPQPGRPAPAQAWNIGVLSCCCWFHFLFWFILIYITF